MLRNIKFFNASELEEKVLKLWKEKNIFKKSLRPKKNTKKKVFNFWEGPPYANGRPGIHHVLSRAFKDVVLRYKTMQGYVVPRKGGWDTHGLLIEIAAEKALGINSKKEIENIGIEKFNDKAKESIFKYKSEWEKLTERMGYWLDLKNAYVTYKPHYIESLWWIFSQGYKNGYLKELYKVVPYCPRCQTVLSSHELGQPGVYKEVSDISIYVKFPIKGKKNEFLLVWTTTPWTLPANVAIAVNENIEYTKFKCGNEYLWAYKIPEGINAIPTKDKVYGKDLKGVEYSYLYKLDKNINLPIKLNTVLNADFVSTEDGTGIVHIAPTFGEDDFNLIFKDGIEEEHIIPETVNSDGKIKDGVIGEGLFVKDADKVIINDLKERKLLLLEEKIEHEYPHCWRCSSPLLYMARKSWFFQMSKLRKELVKSNKKVNWIPKYIKNGRFGEWISQARDWAISRERFWGAPLPIWKCDKCSNIMVADSLNYLNKNRFYSNNYIVMRHGEATSNTGNWIASDENSGSKISKLTAKGIKQVKKAGKELTKMNIDIIMTSPFKRTLHTAEIISKITGAKIKIDKRLREIKVGKFNGKNISEYKKVFKNELERFDNAPKGGETLNELRKRAYSFLESIDKKYNNKNILIVSHGDLLWMLESAVKHLTKEESLKVKYIKVGEFRKIKYDNFPTDNYGMIDMHRPYTDNISLKCNKCGSELKRISDVADVWFDSGSMPYASIYFPFDKKSIETIKGKKIPKGFPADFISEGIDQTRGWFYTLMAVATILGFGTPYKNVMSLGLVLDKYGQKMSKSRGNVVDPWEIINKNGIDAIRWYFYTINAPGEPKNFDPQEVTKTLRKFILILYNSYSFLKIYGKNKLNLSKVPFSENVLDKWILSRLMNTIKSVSSNMDDYNILRATQSIELLSDDISRWYIRRSRRRFQKPDNKKTWEQASKVLSYILLQFSKLSAPFIPFFSEELYQSLKKDYQFNSKDSVHLEEFPKIFDSKINNKLEFSMDEIRNLASKVLAKRSENGIKVRQPLASLKINKDLFKYKIGNDLFSVLKDEINVKNIIVDKSIKEEFVLDMNITPELKNEGIIRELIRMIQGLRQSAGYIPSQKVDLWIKSEQLLIALIQNNFKEITSEINAKNIIYAIPKKWDAVKEGNINEFKITMWVKKV